MMNNVGGVLYTGEVKGTVSFISNPLGVAKEVINALPDKNITFRMLHQYAGRRECYGYLQEGKMYGQITIRTSTQQSVTYFFHNDVWTERIDNFGCNSLEELAAALKPLM